MSSSTSETDGKQPKQTRTSHLSRDKPLFASRRALPSLQQQSDFFTDSLNTSYIPSPSPQKNASRQSVGAKPRQAFVNGKSLAAAFKATAPMTDENKPPSIPSSSNREPPWHTAKPRSEQVSPRTPPRPAKSPPKEPERTRTPSPHRGRQAATASPASSASSPPRGLAEAYQRIVDEENLAGQENEDMYDGTDEMTSDGYHYIQTDRSHDTDRLRLQRLRDSASPISLKASRRASPRGTIGEIIAAEEREREHEHGLPEIGSESGMSFLDDLTDDSIGRALARHARDEQRLNGLVKRDSQPFAKARVGEKVGLTVENLKSKNGSNGSSGSGTIGGSISSRGSEPSLNIPREWGRKAKGGKDWLSRINGRSGKFTGDVPIDPKVAITIDPEKKESAGRIVDWVAAAADVPLPSVEEGSSHIGSASQSSTPMTILYGRTSLDRVHEWEINDDDFTARSLQVSDSPPLRIRNATLDRIREREIESLEKRAVTTSRLDELREKSSLGNLGRRSPNARVEEPQRRSNGDMDETSHRRLSSPELSLESISEDNQDDDVDPEVPLKSEEQTKPVADTPVFIYKSSPKFGNEDASAGQTEFEKDRRPSLPASSHREDPRDLLRSLARATSASPSPIKENEMISNSDPKKPEDEAVEVSKQTPEEMLHRAAAQTQSQSTGKRGLNRITNVQPPSEGSNGIAKTPQQPKAKIYVETPLVTGAWIDTVKTPIQSQTKPTMDIKTPLVTGGWIDTPLPAGGRGLPLPTPEDSDARKDLAVDVDDLFREQKDLRSGKAEDETQQHQQRVLRDTGPDRPKSALAAILEKAKRIPRKRRTAEAPSSEEDNTLALGDDTIQSLEDLVVNDELDISTLLIPSEPTIDVNADDSDSPLTSTQKARQVETQGYDRLTTRLSKLGLSIRDAKKGIATLEQAVSNTAVDEQCNEAGEFHDFIWPCQKCGCSGRSDGAALRSSGERGWEISIPIPRLWRWRDGDWRPRLTWFGLVSLSAILLVAEIIACDMYSPPFYATHMVSFGVDLDRPRPPFILAKLLLRSPAGYIIKPLWFVFISVLKFFTRSLAKAIRFLYEFIFGERDGTAQAVSSGHRMRQPVAKDMRIPRPSWAPDLSMMDDEYI